MTRNRRKQVAERSQRLPDQDGPSLGGALVDIFGAIGRRILNGLVVAQSKPQILACLSGHVRGEPELQERVLEADLKPQALWRLGDLVRRQDGLQQFLDELDGRLEAGVEQGSARHRASTSAANRKTALSTDSGESNRTARVAGQPASPGCGTFRPGRIGIASGWSVCCSPISRCSPPPDRSSSGAPRVARSRPRRLRRHLSRTPPGQGSPAPVEGNDVAEEQSSDTVEVPAGGRSRLLACCQRWRAAGSKSVNARNATVQASIGGSL